uniref:MADS-box domain-containing protein n=1 Tax=Setaria digitata TaxID=48799 RepID=A0A915PTX9_9BILA
MEVVVQSKGVRVVPRKRILQKQEEHGRKNDLVQVGFIFFSGNCAAMLFHQEDIWIVQLTMTWCICQDLMFSGAPAGETEKEATLPEPAKKRPRIQEVSL